MGTGLALLGGRDLLARRPALTPATTTARLETLQRWDPDPWRRREASLLLAARSRTPVEQRQWLRGQGWGPDPLAALVLKKDALAAAALGRPEKALSLWRQLDHRFPADPARADALYFLGEQDPGQRRLLLKRFPAHPAALAAALAAGPDPGARRDGALHLARWGARWPGGLARLRQVCEEDAATLSPEQKAQLAEGLAELGDGSGALDCLGRAEAALPASGRLRLARALLVGDGEQQRQAERLLLSVARTAPTSPEADAAVRLLSDRRGPDAAAALGQLPARWRDSAPVQARRILDAEPPGPGPHAATDAAALALLRRWPLDPASRQLQWDLVRERLLAGRWREALTLLEAIPTEQLPPPLAARQSFWIGFAQQQLGQGAAARGTWEALLRRHPGGYYGWRASVRLGQGDLDLSAGPHRPVADTDSHGGRSEWRPLASGDGTLDRLWRLDQRTEAWETWRHRRGRRDPEGSQELLLEGRLRQGVGDDWTAFGLLERAGLRLGGDQCALERQLERSLHPLRFPAAFTAAAKQAGLPEELLLGVAKQESRFTPAVRSPVGATGLMQLMPATAAELAGGPVPETVLEDPAENALLGGRYLARMLRQWNGNPLLAVASYNAGPGAVAGWVGPQLASAPELWVEAIPYPETRLYVKKVLGNVWSYQQGSEPGC